MQNLLCFAIGNRIPPPFSFSRKKKRSAVDGVRRKRDFGAAPGRTVLLFRAAARRATSQPIWCKGDTFSIPDRCRWLGEMEKCPALFYCTMERQRKQKIAHPF